MQMINMIHVGIGPLGQKIVRYAVERGCFNIVGAVDSDPEKTGRELGELCDIDPLGIIVSSNLDEAIKGKSAEVALVTTVSSI
jgi:4-hydroxy-tetrahydrodipicolinate reductase